MVKLVFSIRYYFKHKRLDVVLDSLRCRERKATGLQPLSVPPLPMIYLKVILGYFSDGFPSNSDVDSFRMTLDL